MNMEKKKILLSLSILAVFTLVSCQKTPVNPKPDPDVPIDPVDPLKIKGLRMPAEFEPVSMVKMCYPNNMPLSAYKEISEDNKILLLCNPNSNGRSRINTARNALEEEGANMDNITFLDMDLDYDYAYWVRDFSPFYVFKDAKLTAVDFTYNRNRPEQNNVPRQIAEYLDIGYSKMDLVHTGGNLMQNGRGTAFSDDLVVQENNDNEQKVRNQMKQYTGTDNYVITIDPQGDYIAHIDCWGKIVAPDKIIVARLPQSNPRYSYYEQVANELANTKCSYGYNYRIYRVDEPGGDTVAPYTNSLIANGHVYMPLGEDASYNEAALQVYRDALPGYEIHGIEGFDKYDEYGRYFLNTDALHCRTHEIPDQNMIFIDFHDVYSNTVSLQNSYEISADIVSYAGATLEEENVQIHFKINNGEWQVANLTQKENTTNYTYTFEGLSSGDDVKYYIDARDNNNNYNVDPTCGDKDPHHFTIA